jgi:copper oxidase (laccase) domain-containing protein
VGVIHIGWKGVENKIFFKTIKKFNLSNLKVSIGPHAQKCCYEIKDDLFKKFPESTIMRQSIKYLDLSNEIERFCIKNNIVFEKSSICTIDSDSFNSYRRDNTDLRQWSIVWI